MIGLIKYQLKLNLCLTRWIKRACGSLKFQGWRCFVTIRIYMLHVQCICIPVRIRNRIVRIVEGIQSIHPYCCKFFFSVQSQEWMYKLSLHLYVTIINYLHKYILSYFVAFCWRTFCSCSFQIHLKCTKTFSLPLALNASCNKKE